jgi:hypothetical protein
VELGLPARDPVEHGRIVSTGESALRVAIGVEELDGGQIRQVGHEAFR